MATIKKFNTENFNVNVVNAINLKKGNYHWTINLIVQVTDKETGVNVYCDILEDRMVPMWDISDDWRKFNDDIIDKGIDYMYDDEDLKREFDDMIEHKYIDWLLGEDGCGYELDDKDLAEIFDEFDDSLVIIDGENVQFTHPRYLNMIGYNIDTKNEVYECDPYDEYIAEKTDCNKYVVRKKNDIKIVKDLLEDAA